MKLRRLATPVPWSESEMARTIEKPTQAMDCICEEEKETLNSTTDTSPAVKQILEQEKFNDASDAPMASTFEKEKKKTTSLSTTELFAITPVASDQTTAATTSDAEEAVAREESPTDLATALRNLATACIRGAVSQFPEQWSVQTIVDAFLDNPLHAGKMYSSMVIIRLKSITMKDAEAMATWILKRFKQLIAKVPINKILKLLKDQSNNFIAWSIPKLEEVVRGARKFCLQQSQEIVQWSGPKAKEMIMNVQKKFQKQLEQCCERRRRRDDRKSINENDKETTCDRK